MSNIADRLEKDRAVATASPRAALTAALTKHRAQLERSLPRQMNVDRFISLVNGAASKNPDIAQCEPLSIMQAVGHAARMGLEIDVSGHGYLVPYDDRRRGIKVCQFIPGWQGIVDLINRSGRGVVKTGAVFDGDFFDWDLGLDAFLRHKNQGIETAEHLVYTYAIGYIRGEGGWTPPPIIEVWPVAKIRNHLDTYNKVGTRHYALANGNNWVMYSRKVPLLQVAKYMPKSAEISTAIEAASRADTGEGITLDGDFVFPEGESAAPPPPADHGPSAQELVERIKAAKNRDAADLILDGARHLSAEQIKDLAMVADAKFPRS